MHHRLLLLFALILALCASLIAAPAEALNPLVLFDEGHGQAFVIDQQGDLHLSGLAGLFREAGFDVKSSGQVITPELLSGIDALVISGAFKPFSQAEIDAISGFVERGGRLALMIHIAPTLIPLLNRLGVASTNGAVNETENILGGEGKDFFVTRLDLHPLTQGLRQIAIYGAWGLLSDRRNVTAIAKTGPRAWVDHNRDKRFGPGDAAGEFGIIVAGTLGKGEFAIFGDDAIFQNRFLKDDNLRLGKNLVNWLRLKGPLLSL